MDDAHGMAQWDHTATILSLMANSVPRENGRQFKPDEFHPYHQRRADIGPPDDFDAVSFLENHGL